MVTLFYLSLAKIAKKHNDVMTVKMTVTITNKYFKKNIYMIYINVILLE